MPLAPETLHVHLTEEDFDTLTDEYAELLVEDCAWDSEANCLDILVRIPEGVQV